jgi:hypothetical protein
VVRKNSIGSHLTDMLALVCSVPLPMKPKKPAWLTENSSQPDSILSKTGAEADDRILHPGFDTAIDQQALRSHITDTRPSPPQA